VLDSACRLRLRVGQVGAPERPTAKGGGAHAAALLGFRLLKV